LCDHYEPLWHGASSALAAERVQSWVSRYPKLAARYRDADGLAPRHTFFFPGEEYAPRYLDGLAELAKHGHGEVELHLHHNGATAGSLKRDLSRYLSAMAEHGHLSRDARSGAPRFAFIHGNWCLANARRDGRWCGVDEELPLLFQAGCYADFTFPAAPDESQPAIVNQIYWPAGDLARRRAYESGETATVGETRRDRLLIIQGPLALTWKKSWPPLRIENGNVTGADPATPHRIDTWVAQHIHVRGRPEWFFVKAHTHGAQEETMSSLLGDGGHALHDTLTRRYNDGTRWRLHYVTAREMFNIACAAMAGCSGDPGDYRNFVLPPPPVAG
jgi:hypothetical protein